MNAKRTGPRIPPHPTGSDRLRRNMVWIRNSQELEGRSFFLESRNNYEL